MTVFCARCNACHSFAGSLSEAAENFESSMALELGSIHNINAVFMESISVWHEIGLGNAFAPFDLDFWCNRRSDSSLRLGCYLWVCADFRLFDLSDLEVCELGTSRDRHPCECSRSATSVSSCPADGRTLHEDMC